jgi:hypothetical protein
MSQTILPSDLVVNGNINCRQLVASQASITNAMLAAPATPAAAVATSKLRHRSIITLPFNGNSTAAAAVIQIPAHVVFGTAGEIVAFGAGSVAVAVGAATVVVDLLKNGASILTATITLDNANVARVIEAAPGFSATTLAAGDMLEAKIVSAVAGGGTLPAGTFFRLVVDEDPS